MSDYYIIDHERLKNAYEDIPESLVKHFNTASEAEKEHAKWVNWSIFWFVASTPVVLYTGSRVFDEKQILQDVQDELLLQMNSQPKILA